MRCITACSNPPSPHFCSLLCGCPSLCRRCTPPLQRRWLSLLGLTLVLSLCLAGTPLVAQETAPGLHGVYTSGASQVTRVVSQVVVNWGDPGAKTEPSAETLRAVFRGTLIVPAAGRYRFPAWVQGRVVVRLGGRIVTQAERAEPGWGGGEEVELDGQDAPLEIEYTSAGPQGELKLLWSGPGFFAEPLPGRALEHVLDDDTLPAHDDTLVQGVELWASRRCAACHAGDVNTPLEPGPALSRVATTISAEWFVNWLAAPRDRGSHRGHSPNLGLTRAEAADLLAALRTGKSPAPGASPPAGGDKTRSQPTGKLPAGKLPADKPAADKQSAEAQQTEAVVGGRELVQSVGCLACHVLEGAGTAGAWSGPNFADLIGKRSAAHWREWLESPAQLNARHRMPVFPLSESERSVVADWLEGLELPADEREAAAGAKGDEGRAIAEPGDAARGMALLQRHRCAVCHELPEGVAPEATAVADRDPKAPPLAALSGQSHRGCLAETPPVADRQPWYRLAEGERRALQRFVSSPQNLWGTALGHTVPGGTAPGAIVWNRRGCASCHARDGAGGLRPVVAQLVEREPAWRGQTEGLLPPDLAAVGDKLRDDWLRQAVGGEQPRRLPWLRVRMPRFAHSDAEREALARWFERADRIPPEPPGGEPESLARLAASAEGPEWRAAGLVVGGGRGFSCVGCHKVGPFEPRGVGLATRGSDLYRIDQRLRPEFFSRWVRGPLRVVPNHEMPAFVRPLEGVLEGRLEQQLAALWKVLSDPAKAPQFDTSTIEQAPVPAPGGPPLVVRDLFQLGGPLKAESIPRGAAVGFPNGLSLLLDWDRFALRGWWSGAFARQRAAGKSWFWEPAGELVHTRPGARPDLELLDRAGAPLSLVEQRERWGELLGWQTAVGRLRWQYRLKYTHAAGPGTALVTEELVPSPADGLAENGLGWRRTVLLQDESGQVRGVRLAQPVQEAPLQTMGDGPVFRLEQTFAFTRGESTARGAAATGPVVTGQAVTGPGGAGPGVAGSAGIGPASEWPTVDTVPGYRGVRLPFPSSLMPTALALRPDGSLALCSLKGQVYVARDGDGDGIPEQISLFEEGLAAPFGILADGYDLLVAHKPEVLRLKDTDGDGRADVREVVATGWGYTDDYHDWTTGVVRDSRGRLYIGLGSDYSKGGRTAAQGYLRGKVLRIERDGVLTPMGHQFRFPMGLAINAADEVFVSDNQGVQNPFNEINHLVEGGRYGVPSLFEEPSDQAPRSPAIQVPHPWTRSVNGLFFLNADPEGAFAGDGVGCEYDSRFLVRFQVEQVAGRWQGAVFPFSLAPQQLLTAETRRQGPARGFLGTLCGTQGPRGEMYIGAIHDSGWTGGANVGEVVRLVPSEEVPQGLRSISVRPEGLQLRFTRPIVAERAAEPTRYALSGLTREWKGGYATPDSGQHRPTVERVDVSPDRLTVTLHCTGLRRGFVYEVRVGDLAEEPLWPTVGYYTLHALPGDSPEEGAASGPPAEGK
jgi:cytochrome c2